MRFDEIKLDREPYLLGILRSHEPGLTPRDLDGDAVCLVIGEAPTDNELSNGRPVLLDYNGRQGKCVRLRADQCEYRDGCDERNTRWLAFQSIANGQTKGRRRCEVVSSTIDPSRFPGRTLCGFPNTLEDSMYVNPPQMPDSPEPALLYRPAILSSSASPI